MWIGNHVQFLRYQKLYTILQPLHNTEIKGFKIIFGKPVNGQRTGSNGKTAKKQQTSLFMFKFGNLQRCANYALPKTVFISEYVNLFWQQQFLPEWLSGFKKLRFLPLFIRKTNFVDISSMIRFHIYHFYKNPFKQKIKIKNKRKKVIPKNKIPIGFRFGFSKKYKKQFVNLIV